MKAIRSISKQGTRDSNNLSPSKAYTLLMRFLNNPCPNIALRILEYQEDINRIVRQYRRLISAGSVPSGYIEGAKMFLRTFDQVERVIDKFGYRDLNRLDEEGKLVTKVMRFNPC